MKLHLLCCTERQGFPFWYIDTRCVITIGMNYITEVPDFDSSISFAVHAGMLLAITCRTSFVVRFDGNIAKENQSSGFNDDLDIL